MLQNPHVSIKEKKKAATKNPKDYNDARVPSELKSYILTEQMQAQAWSVSGPQFNDQKDYPNLQQRYCYPKTDGNGEYKCIGASIYIIATGIGDEDPTYRLLHVYYSEARAASWKKGNGRYQVNLKISRSVNDKEIKHETDSGAEYPPEVDNRKVNLDTDSEPPSTEENAQNRHVAYLDVDPDAYFGPDENDTNFNSLGQMDFMESSNSMNYASTNSELLFPNDTDSSSPLKLEDSSLDADFFKRDVTLPDEMTLLSLTCNSWDYSDDDDDSFHHGPIPSDSEEVLGILTSEHSGPKSRKKASPCQESNLDNETIISGTNGRDSEVEQKSTHMLSTFTLNPMFRNFSSQLACNNGTDTNNESNAFSDEVRDNIETAEVDIYNALCRVDESEFDRCLSLVAAWALKRAHLYKNRKEKEKKKCTIPLGREASFGICNR